MCERERPEREMDGESWAVLPFFAPQIEVNTFLRLLWPRGARRCCELQHAHLYYVMRCSPACPVSSTTWEGRMRAVSCWFLFPGCIAFFFFSSRGDGKGEL